MWDNATEQNNQNTMSDTVIKYNKTCCNNPDECYSWGYSVACVEW